MTAEPPLLLAKAHYPVTALGPGVRAGIWTQGCTLQCPGCLSRDTWDPDPGTAVPVRAVLGWLASLPEPIDGITISGGEPFQQPAALAALLRALHSWRDARRTSHAWDVSQGEPDILLYSGYVYTRLSRSADWREILDMCDAVVAGPYVERLNLAGPRLLWRGSANQRIVALSPLGRERYARIDDDQQAGAPHGEGSRIQVSVDEGPEGRRVYYIGIPRRGDMERLEATLEHAGVRAGDVSWRA